MNARARWESRSGLPFQCVGSRVGGLCVHTLIDDHCHECVLVCGDEAESGSRERASARARARERACEKKTKIETETERWRGRERERVFVVKRCPGVVLRAVRRCRLVKRLSNPSEEVSSLVGNTRRYINAC